MSDEKTDPLSEREAARQSADELSVLLEVLGDDAKWFLDNFWHHGPTMNRVRVLCERVQRAELVLNAQRRAHAAVDAIDTNSPEFQAEVAQIEERERKADDYDRVANELQAAQETLRRLRDDPFASSYQLELIDAALASPSTGEKGND